MIETENHKSTVIIGQHLEHLTTCIKSTLVELWGDYCWSDILSIDRLHDVHGNLYEDISASRIYVGVQLSDHGGFELLAISAQDSKQITHRIKILTREIRRSYEERLFELWMSGTLV